MRSMKWPRDGACVVEDQLPPPPPASPFVSRDLLRDFKSDGMGDLSANSLSRVVCKEASLNHRTDLGDDGDVFHIQPVQLREV